MIDRSDSDPEPAALDMGSCPLPLREYEHVLLGHGSGGSLTSDLIQQMFLRGYGNEILAGLEDQAVVRLDRHHAGGHGSTAMRVAITTDAFVVQPLFFPGGDIGKLAVHGTVNDLAVGGALPLYLAAAFIIEEGLPMESLARIVESMRQACAEAGVLLVTGDTKVVDRGKGDGVFITTTGLGLVPDNCNISVKNARPGDRVIVSGTIGNHGIAIMSVREGLEFETLLKSDTAPLNDLVQTMLKACPTIRWMRDPTRGGLSSSLNELAEASGVGVRLDEAAIPLRPQVQAACEMLGLDPLYVANEGILLAVVPDEDAEELVEVMRRHPLGREAATIGEVLAEDPGMVVQTSLIGGERVVARLAGEQLPRIC
jgi:hydrogenase expression/formation protein HypE